MTPTLDTPMRPHNQFCPPKTGTAVTPNEEKELRAALLMVVGALDARPKPSDFWDMIARKDADVRHPRWLSKLPEVLRSALDAGREEGPGSQAATVHRVHVFFSALEALTLKGYELASAEDLGAALVDLTTESADVTVAASRALHEPSEGNLEALRFAVMESETQDERILDLASRRLAMAHADREPQRQVANR